MKDTLTWQYDEFQQIGKDYSSQQEVEVYDASHADFRDVEKECNAILDAIHAGADDTVVDFGAGTGAFAILAARRCSKVVAVDVSEAMIKYAQTKAAIANVSNIEFCHGGFLNYDYGYQSVDAIVTTFAFHHLPDFWKGVALSRMHRMLKPGGRLYMTDVILEQENAVGNITAFIEKQAAAGGDFLREDAELHFKQEYSTYDWVMEGLLTRAGFTIKNRSMEAGVIGSYLCIKNVNSK